MIRFRQNECKSLTKPKWQDSLNGCKSPKNGQVIRFCQDGCKSLTKPKWQDSLNGCKSPKTMAKW